MFTIKIYDDLGNFTGETKEISAGLLERLEQGKQIFITGQSDGFITTTDYEPVKKKRAVRVNSFMLIGMRVVRSICAGATE